LIIILKLIIQIYNNIILKNKLEII